MEKMDWEKINEIDISKEMLKANKIPDPGDLGPRILTPWTMMIICLLVHLQSMFTNHVLMKLPIYNI